MGEIQENALKIVLDLVSSQTINQESALVLIKAITLKNDEVKWNFKTYPSTIDVPCVYNVTR